MCCVPVYMATCLSRWSSGCMQNCWCQMQQVLHGEFTCTIKKWTASKKNRRRNSCPDKSDATPKALPYIISFIQRRSFDDLSMEVTDAWNVPLLLLGDGRGFQFKTFSASIRMVAVLATLPTWQTKNRRAARNTAAKTIRASNDGSCRNTQTPARRPSHSTVPDQSQGQRANPLAKPSTCSSMVTTGWPPATTLASQNSASNWTAKTKC